MISRVSEINTPGCNAQYDSVWLLEDECSSRGCDRDSASDGGNSTGNVSHNLNRTGQVDVPANDIRCAGILTLVARELVNPRLQDVGSLEEDLPDLLGLRLPP